MSRTLIPGVVGPSHWAYTALVISKRLNEIISAREVRGNEIPTGVYEAAREFFDLVGGALEYKEAHNLVASNNAYLIALEALHTSEETSKENSPEVLRDHSEFLQTLNNPRLLHGDELGRARDLQEFFGKLRELGTADRYMNAVHSDEPSQAIGYR
jgi:hypothetical protein